VRVIETVAGMRGARSGLAGPVALVATMGALHAGHEAHLVKARTLAAVVVGSLFVNPTQFGPDEDLAGYPRPRERDLEIFERTGADIVFAPATREMYPAGESVRVHPGSIGNPLEGSRRPGHFTGVATIVAKLFNIIRPDIATFGEKDAQQLRVVRQLNRDLMFGVEIVPIPTVREPDGLAMSSRNVYLNTAERAAAPVLYRALCRANEAWNAGERDSERLRRLMQGVLAREPLAQPDYVSVADPGTLEELSTAAGDALASMAVRIGPAHLIDNLLLKG
jgi:pantoate--beta-alanine ligase